MTSESAVSVGVLVESLSDRFPPSWAEEWDRVGLVVGDRAALVTGVLVTLDATAEAVARAVDLGASVLVTHHPPYLEPPVQVVAGPGPDGALEAALRSGVAIVSMHTNLDRAPEGASALARTLDLEIVAPLESASERVAVVTTYAPENAADALRAAMAAAGAGRLGEYSECSFTSGGVGHFEPLASASPVVSATTEGVPEVRIEMLASLASVDRVLAAAHDAHPYEEPVIVAVPGVRARGAARLGRLCTWRQGATLGELASHVSQTLGVACRVWGDADQRVARIAVANGSASSLVSDARATADALIAGEVRYHDALAAAAAGLAVIEAGHDVTEWPIVAVLAEAVRESVPYDVPVAEEPPGAGWWTMEEPDVRG